MKDFSWSFRNEETSGKASGDFEPFELFPFSARDDVELSRFGIESLFDDRGTSVWRLGEGTGAGKGGFPAIELLLALRSSVP